MKIIFGVIKNDCDKVTSLIYNCVVHKQHNVNFDTKSIQRSTTISMGQVAVYRNCL